MGLTREEKENFISNLFLSIIYIDCMCDCQKKKKKNIYIVLETIAKVSPYYTFLIELYKDYKEL